MKKKKRKRPLKLLKKDAWAVFSQYIRIRDQGVCFTCGVHKPWKEMHAGHFKHLPKECESFDERNVNTQCVGCNKYRGGKLDVYAERLVKRYGPEILEELSRMKHETRKYTRDEILKIIEKYKEKIGLIVWGI